MPPIELNNSTVHDKGEIEQVLANDGNWNYIHLLWNYFSILNCINSNSWSFVIIKGCERWLKYCSYFLSTSTLLLKKPWHWNAWISRRGHTVIIIIDNILLPCLSSSSPPYPFSSKTEFYLLGINFSDKILQVLHAFFLKKCNNANHT